MQNDGRRRYLPQKRGGGILVVLLALGLAAGIPAGLIALREAMGSPDPAASASSLPEPVPSSSEVAPTSTPRPTPRPPMPVAESAAVEQGYFDDAVFFGDSISEGVKIYPGMDNATVIATTGANPDSALSKESVTVEGSSARVTMIEALTQAAPGKIYIMLGANWVGENTGISKETFLSHYEALILQILGNNPGSIVYLQSMLPVSESFSANEKGTNKVGLTNPMIDDYNAALMVLANDLGVNYLDVHAALKGETGALPDEATKDGMHLVPEYYEKWFEYLKTHTAAANPGPPLPMDGSGDVAAGGGALTSDDAAPSDAAAPSDDTAPSDDAASDVNSDTTVITPQ